MTCGGWSEPVPAEPARPDDRGVGTVTPLCATGGSARPYGGSGSREADTPAAAAPAPTQESTLTREPDHGAPGPRGLGTQQDRAPASARTWARRLLHTLVRLDSWSPDGSHLSSPQAARRHLRGEWTRSGDLTRSQAAVLVALDETTAWTV